MFLKQKDLSPNLTKNVLEEKKLKPRNQSTKGCKETNTESNRYRHNPKTIGYSIYISIIWHRN